MSIVCIALLYAGILFISPSLIPDVINNTLIHTEFVVKKKDVIVMIKNLLFSFFILLIGFLTIQVTQRKKKRMYLILLISLFSQLYYFNKYISLGFKQFLYPQNTIFEEIQKNTSVPNRFIVFGKPVLSNISTQEELYSPEGLDPIFPYRFGQLVNAANTNGHVIKDIPRIEVNLSELDEKSSIFNNPKRLRLLSLLGTTTFAYYDKGATMPTIEKFPNSSFQELYSKDNWHIFEYKYALPRAFFADRIIIQKDPQKIVNTLFDSSIDLSKNIIVEDNVSILSQPDLTIPEYVNIKKYESQEIIIYAQSNNNKMLFMSDNFYPGWKGYIDNIPTPIYRADFSFRAIVFPKGSHVITFRYKPTSFQLGLPISLTSLTLFFCLTSFWIVKTYFANRFK